MSNEQVHIENLDENGEAIQHEEADPTIGMDLYEADENLTLQSRLHRRYCFWYMRRHSTQKQTQVPYEENIKPVASFQTIEHFWRVYDHLIKPDQFKQPTDYHLFADGIKPTWEDAANSNGGKWMVRLRKGVGSRYWEELVLALIGEQFDVNNEICGVVISIRAVEDILSVWTKTADDVEAANKIRDQIRRVLRLPNHITMEYKKHQDSITDKSSFRNTTVFRPPVRKEWGQATNTQSEASGDNETEAPNQWDRRQARPTAGAPTRDGDASSSADWAKNRSAPKDAQGAHKKTEEGRGWERSRRYQHPTAAQPAQPNRWSRGLSVPEGTQESSQAEESQSAPQQQS